MSFICIVCRDLLTATGEGETLGAAALPPPREEVDLVATKCGHLYHLQCLTDWFNTQGYGRAVRECPYCKTVINGPADYIKIFPAGDEETDAILEANKKNNHGKNMELQEELKQVHKFLAASEKRLEEESLCHDVLKFEYAQTLSEVEELKRETASLTGCLKMKDATLQLKCESWTKQMEGLQEIIGNHGKLEAEHQVQIQKQKEESEISLKESFKTISDLQALIQELQSDPSKYNNVEVSDEACQTEVTDTEQMTTRLAFFDSCIKYMLVEKENLEKDLNEQFRNLELAGEIAIKTDRKLEAGTNLSSAETLATSNGHKSSDKEVHEFSRENTPPTEDDSENSSVDGSPSTPEVKVIPFGRDTVFYNCSSSPNSSDSSDSGARRLGLVLDID